MKDTELIIGKEYWFNNTKKEKGVYVGENLETHGIYFKPSGLTLFLKYEGLQEKFKDCVGFINSELIIPV